MTPNKLMRLPERLNLFITTKVPAKSPETFVDEPWPTLLIAAESRLFGLILHVTLLNRSKGTLYFFYLVYFRS